MPAPAPPQAVQRVGAVYLAASAVVVGDVTIGADSNIWHQVVIRGDVAPVRIGARVNIQDGSVLHCQKGVPLEVADEVAVGHLAVVHCARVGRRSLVGIRAVVLDGATVGEDCLIAAGALVPPGMAVPDGSVVMGVPGKVVRAIKDEERAYIKRVVEGYVELARRHAAGDYGPFGEARRST